MAAVYSFVEVSHGAYAHDVLPAVMLLEYLKHLVLPGHFAQHTGIFERRDAQQHTVVIFFQAEEIELRGVGEQRTVIVVEVVVYLIVGGVERTYALQKFHFAVGPLLAEHAYGLLRGHFKAPDGYPGIDDLLHTPAYVVHILKPHGMADVEIHEITVGDGYVDDHFRVTVDVVYGFGKHEEKRACVVA